MLADFREDAIKSEAQNLIAGGHKAIRVNAVNPRLIDTQIARDVVSGDEQAYNEIAKTVPIARAGRPAEIASEVLWLCSPGASYVVGHAHRGRRNDGSVSEFLPRRLQMLGTVLYGPRDIRSEDRPEPKIINPTDAILRLSATCICGSDLWPYRGIAEIKEPTPMGHEYCGIVEEVGKEVKNIKPGQFVVGSFATSDNTCVICRDGYQSSCVHREFMSAAQASLLRVPLADGTLVATSDTPSKESIPSLLATSDVLGTGWFAADAANVKPGSTAVVVGDGAVGLLAVLSAKQMGAERIIAMSRHESRQKLAREFGATDIVTERGDEGTARIKEMTKGIGADSVLECVGTQESMLQAIRSARPGGYVSYVGVPHGVELDGAGLFFAHVHLHGGPAPVRRYLPELINLVLDEKINPGKVFDLTLPLDQVAEGYRAMDERRAIKTLLQP